MIRKIYYKLKELRLLLLQLFYSPFLLFPVKKSKIIIVSYKGDGYGDSGKRIVEYMRKKNNRLDYDIYWALSRKEDKDSLPEPITGIKYGSPFFYYHMTTAKFWIDNSHKYEYPFKRKEQLYIQNWHGGLALKKIEKDAEEKLSSYYLRNAEKDFGMVDLFTSNSQFQTDLIRRAFWYDGQIAEVGTPRVDYLLEDLNVEKLKRKIGIPLGKQVILYAPTFRNQKNPDVYIQDFDFLTDTLQNTVVLVRHHPNNKKMSAPSRKEEVIQVTHYPDMYELMKVADLLITDYSSSMFEFSFMKKPVFLLAKDYEQYMDERGMYFDIEELPYILVHDEESLVQSIQEFNQEKYQAELKSFSEGIKLFETGKASQFIYEYIKYQRNKSSV